MNPSRIFILRPIATSLLAVALLLSGILAYYYLPISALPEVDYPIIQVQTFYPGASPEVMANTVTAPLEGQFGQMSGLKQMSSISSGGASAITLQFSLNINLDVAEQEVQAAINAAGGFLPTGLPNPPVYSKVNPADPPIVVLAITSAAMPITKVADYVETRIAPKISQINGVGLVTLSGGQRPAVRIEANPEALAAHGLTLDSVRTIIDSANANLAKGSFDGPLRSYTIDANDQLLTPDDYLNMILSYKNGAAIRLGDVARIIEGPENARLKAWDGLTPAVLVNVQRQPGANVLKVATDIKNLLGDIHNSVPSTMDIKVLTDRTITIQASVDDVQLELMLAVILVALVTFLFLHNLPATFIPTVAVPLSLVGTFGLMYLVGFSLNNLTLMALAIATGFVVDDAIVVIENISRYREMGHSPKEAALMGAKQIGFTIISLTFSLVAVLIPLLFMSDVVGRLFREFAVTLAVSIILSAIISLTLTPMMCAYFLRRTEAEESNRLSQKLDDIFKAIINKYDHGLQWAFKRQGLVLMIFLATLGLSVILYVLAPKGFLPVQDTGIIQGLTEAPQSISFTAMAERQSELAALIMADEDVESLASFIGLDGINSTINNGRLVINLKPLAQRRDRAQAIIARLRGATVDLPGINIYFQAQQDLTIEDRISRSQYQFVLSAINQNDLDVWVPKLIDELNTNPMVMDVASDLQNKGLEAYLNIDRNSMARLGVTLPAVANTLYSAFGQRQVSTIFTQSNQYRVVLEAAEQFVAGPESIENIYVANSTGLPIPLSSFSKIEERPTMIARNRQGQFPAVSISFNLKESASLGEAVTAIEDSAAKISLPPSIQISFQGAVEAFRASLGNTVWLILAAIITVYIVLGVLYESYIHPITILSTLPSAGIGALLALILVGFTLNVVSIIGLILLIGIVKKNAIMMIDFAISAERDEGKSAQEAIHQACLLRFRPIMMTTMAALFGALPLMLGRGMGSELRNPLGLTMVGGLLLSQALTLFTTPVIYLFFERLKYTLQNFFQK